MKRVSSRVAAAERRLGKTARGYCRHLPPIVERWGSDGSLITEESEPESEYARETEARYKAWQVNPGAVCWCGRERVKIIIQYVEKPPAIDREAG